MTGRKAGKGFSALEMLEIEGIGLAADERPAASDRPLDQLTGESRQQHREEQELQARAQSEQQ